MTISKETYPAATPYLIVPDASAMLRFMTAAFAATEQMVQRNPDGSVGHAEMKIGDSLIMLGQAGGAWPARTSALYVWVDDVDATYQRALSAGGTSESAPVDKPYGHRVAGVDMGGVTWWIGAPVRT
ncbi:MAG TPA: VOC family protein [Vicinamibacterales bacterium]